MPTKTVSIIASVTTIATIFFFILAPFLINKLEISAYTVTKDRHLKQGYTLKILLTSLLYHYAHLLCILIITTLLYTAFVIYATELM